MYPLIQEVILIYATYGARNDHFITPFLLQLGSLCFRGFFCLGSCFVTDFELCHCDIGFICFLYNHDLNYN